MISYHWLYYSYLCQHLYFYHEGNGLWLRFLTNYRYVVYKILYRSRNYNVFKTIDPSRGDLNLLASRCEIQAIHLNVGAFRFQSLKFNL
jgi:hypothetical protein